VIAVPVTAIRVQGTFELQLFFQGVLVAIASKAIIPKPDNAADTKSLHILITKYKYEWMKSA
jgi:hypothetical protein